MTVIVRVDDYPTGDKQGVIWPGYNKLFDAFDDVMAMRDVCYMLGVVPSFYERDWDWFCDHIEIAVHGYDHTSAVLDPPYNEFAGCAIEGACSRLKRGFVKLSEFNPHVFIAPFNGYTNETLRALEQVGCKCVCTGPETDMNLDFGGLTVVPSDFYGRSEELVEQIRTQGLEDSRVQCVTLHWTWEIKGIVNGNGKLPELLDMIAPYVKPWGKVFGW